MPTATYMAKKQAERDAHRIVNKVVKATLPKGCSLDKVCFLRRVECHHNYLLELSMSSTGRPRHFLVLCRWFLLSGRGVINEKQHRVVAWCSMVQMVVLLP